VIRKRRARASASSTGRWILLIHQIPPKPDYLRVKISRRLQRIGAVAIKNSVYVLPAGDATLEDFQWVLREITTEGGEGSVCRASFVDGLTDAEVEELFRRARSSDYDEIADTALAALKALPRVPDADERTRARAELARLQRRIADLSAVDFFAAPARAKVDDLMGRLEARLRATLPGETGAAKSPRSKVDARDVRGRRWVTRQGVFVDRIASAWLIRRSIDPDARFAFVPAEGYVPKPGELRFDMFEAEFTHEGDRCTFETLINTFGLRGDRALRAVAEIVHDIDVKDAKFGRTEAAGFERLLAGLVAKYPRDDDRIEQGALLFDMLYNAFRPA
jgi:hypothetical protein